MPYVSITGLQVKSVWQWPHFAWHAIRSMTQAQKSQGCLRAEARSIDGVQHTLSVWRDRDAMRQFMMSGAHRDAMRVFRKIATGSTFGYESDDIPDWTQARKIWEERGKTY